MVSIFVHILLIFVAFLLSPRPKVVSPRVKKVLKWHTLQLLSKIGIWLLQMTKRRHLQNVWKTKSCNYPRRLARYLYFIYTFATAVHLPHNQTTQDPTSRSALRDQWARSDMNTSHTQRKGKFRSTGSTWYNTFCICRFHSMIHGYSGFIIFSGEY